MFNFLGIVFHSAKIQPNNSETRRHSYLETWEKEAIVDEAISPYHPGRARFRNSIWPARCVGKVTLEPEQVCEVVGMHNITLIVKPIEIDEQETTNN